MSQVIHTPYGTLYYDNKNSWRFPGQRETANTAHAWAWRQRLLHDDKPAPAVLVTYEEMAEEAQSNGQ